MTTSRYCLCGATLHARSTPPAMADRIVAEFDRWHTDPGCGPATATQASAARRREDRKVAG